MLRVFFKVFFKPAVLFWACVVAGLSPSVVGVFGLSAIFLGRFVEKTLLPWLVRFCFNVGHRWVPSLICSFKFYWKLFIRSELLPLLRHGVVTQFFIVRGGLIELFNFISTGLTDGAWGLYRYCWGSVWPELSRQCIEILAYCYKFYKMQEQRTNVFSQFFAARRTAALRMLRGFIYSSRRPILMLRAFTRILVGDIIQAVRVSGSPRGTTIARILFCLLCLVIFIGCGLLFIL